MRRILFRIGGRPVWSYPALLYIGLVSGFYVMYAVAPMLNMPSPAAAMAVLILFAPALVGARLWFVFDHWTIYRHTPARIWRRAEGGMALYGGLVLALAFSPLVLNASKLGFAQFWDGATFTMLVGMLVTRFGCLLNGCCSGRPCDGRIGMRLADQRGHIERRYPVQLLEIGCAAALLGICTVLLVLGAFHGAIFVAALAGYSVVRLVLDPMRQRPPSVATGRRSALAIFVVCSLVASVAGWVVTAL